MSAPSDRWVVVAEDVTRTYRTGAEEVHALRSLDLRVPEGRMLAVTGRSGSGKTTLLNCLGGLDRPDSGRITVAGHDLTALDEDGLLRLRRETVGFIFQTFALIPILSARENVGLPLRLLGVDAGEREERVATLLGLVDLTEHAEQRPNELSGGQQQRVAIARALVTRPQVLLADEPTGQLDSGTGRAIMQLIRAVVDSLGVTAVVATHDAIIIDTADTVHDLHDGEFGGRHRATGPAA